MAKQYGRPEFVNTFTGGMRGDRDPLLQDPNSYRYSLNGRLVFNRAGTYAWENEAGNTLSFELPEDYIPIGAVEMPDRLIIFSTDQTNSEIGFVEVDANNNATYTTAFNDQYDPNGDVFGFDFAYPIRAWAVIESAEKMRVYWTDNHREMYTFNVVAGLQSINPDFVDGDYQPLVSTGKYPFWYSVNQCQWYSDFAMGKLKFSSRIGTVASPEGALKTGMFQYAYRLGTREGYWTPFCPLTRGIFLTNIDLTPTDSNDYFMTNSNVATPYAFELTIDGLDARYYYLEVAYVYSIDYNATVESNIFYHARIDPTDMIGDELTVTHRSHTGTPVNIDDYNVRPVFIERAADIIEKDQRLWFPNVSTDGSYEIDTYEVEVEPVIRTFVGDENGATENPPLTQVSPSQTTVSVRSYINNVGADVNDTYVIDGDYVNYKGMQFEHLFKGYWRGETYPIGIVWFNRKGIPFYAQNLMDVTLPEQYDLDGNGDPYVLTDVSYNLRAMGLSVSGIRVDDDFLYDDLGNLKVSGFAIVRCKRVPKTLYQAIIMPTVYSKDTSGEESWTRPTPMPSQYLAEFYAQESFVYDVDFKRETGETYGNRPSVYILHSPELFFGFDVYGQTGQTGLLGSDVLKIVSQNASVYETNAGCLSGDHLIDLYGGSPINHYYTKNYATAIDYISTYDMGDFTRMETINRISFSNSATDPTDFILAGYDPQNLPLEFHGQTQVVETTCSDCDTESFNGSQAQDSYLVKTKDWNTKLSNYDYDTDNNIIYSVVNYVAASSQYYNEFNSDTISTRRYIGTGHFQPINQSVLNAVDQNDGTYLFDGIEVWGGDCYVNFFDFLRVYPRYWGDCATPACGEYRSYSAGLIVPMESNLNVAMRKGRSYSSVGVETENDACGDGETTLEGLNMNQPEEFNMNSVLLYQENVQFYPGIPSVEDVTIKNFPNRWVYTPEKFYNELTDNYRRVLANNYGDVIGLYGDLQGGILWQNQIYSFQPRGWGRLRVNDRSLISTQNEEVVQTGSGAVFAGIDYFSHNYGTQHIFSLIGTERGFYWADVINRAFMRYGAGGQEIISDTREQHDFANYTLNFYDIKTRTFINNEYRWIMAARDRLNGEVIWSLANNQDIPIDNPPASLSISFNENTDCFTTYHSYDPVFITQYRQYVFSADNQNYYQVYIHNLGDYGSFYGVIYDSVVTNIINPLPNLEKRFDNSVLNVNEEGAGILTQVTHVTETETVQLASFQSYTKQVYRYDNLVYAYPLDSNNERLHGKHLELTTYWDNYENELVKFSSLRSFFRPAHWT